MSRIWPEYFFTASFLKELDGECTRREETGEKLGVLNRFLSFLEEARGKIFIDTDKLEIGESRRLRSWFTETDQRLGPYIRSAEPQERVKDILDGIALFDTSFTGSFSSNQIDAMMRTVHKPIFNMELLKSKWDFLSGWTFPEITGGRSLNWLELLSKYILPSSQILICDPYIAGTENNVDMNLLPILKACRSISKSQPKILIISKEAARFDLKQYLKKELGDLGNIEIILLPSWDESYKEHDRRILTDQLFLNIPGGLDLLNQRGKVGLNKSTEIALRSIYTGNPAQVQAIIKTKARLHRLIDYHTPETNQV
jgi:hypothetical protein